MLSVGNIRWEATIMKTVKYAVIMLCSICILINSPVSVKAGETLADSVDRLLEDRIAERESVKDELEEVIKKSAYKNDEMVKGYIQLLFVPSSYDLDAAIKVNRCDSFLVTGYKEKGSFSKMVGEQYQWKIPIKNEKEESGYITVGEKDGVLTYLGTDIGANCKNEFITEEQISKILKSNTLSDKAIVSLNIAQNFLYNMTLVIVDDGSQEFVITLPINPETSPVKRGCLYKAEEVVQLFDEIYDEQYLIDHPNDNGGIPLKNRYSQVKAPDNGKEIIFLIPIIFLIVLGLSMLYIIKEAKTKNKGKNTQRY